MAIEFLSDSEIITVAMNLEQEGYRFYDRASKISNHRQTKEIFNKLREEERQHYEIFEDLLSKLPDTTTIDYFDISDQIRTYLKSLIETGIFRDKAKTFAKTISQIQALEIGINVERDSILFYTEALKMCINPKAKSILVDIIEIEKRHLVVLTDRLRITKRLF